MVKLTFPLYLEGNSPGPILNTSVILKPEMPKISKLKFIGMIPGGLVFFFTISLLKW